MAAADTPIEERVKPCIKCGAIMPFDEEVCSLCGTRAAGTGEGEEAVKPCMACEELISEEDLFCPKCGDFSLRVAADTSATDVVPLGIREGGAVSLLARGLAVVIMLLAVVVTVTVILEAWRVRDLGRP